MIFGADEGDMIVNKATGLRTPITDTGKEFVLDIYVPDKSVGETREQNPHEQNKSVTRGGDKSERIEYGCEATTGGFWNSLIVEDEDPVCQECCPATFRRHP